MPECYRLELKGSFDYLVYGLRLRADRSLYGLDPIEPADPPDIEVTLTEQGRSPAPVPPEAWVGEYPALPFWKATLPEGVFARVLYSGGEPAVEFVLGPGGRQVWVSWTGDVTLEDVTSLLTGTMLGCLLQLRGLTCLHGAVVAVDGRGLVFLGPRGAGKSTTALACVQRGATLVSDDLVVLAEGLDGFSIEYGQPALRLRPNSAESLCGPFEQLRPVWSEARGWHPKRYLDIQRQAKGANPRIPLEAIYLLGPRDSTTGPLVERQSTAAALAILLSQRPNPFIHDHEAQVRDLDVLGRLAAKIPVSRLIRPEGLESLGELIEVVLADSAAKV